jgi:hypothetical protein
VAIKITLPSYFKRIQGEQTAKSAPYKHRKREGYNQNGKAESKAGYTATFPGNAGRKEADSRKNVFGWHDKFSGVCTTNGY